jgi:hypothetical protein
MTNFIVTPTTFYRVESGSPFHSRHRQEQLAAPAEDLRNLPLLERKRRLRRVVPRGKRLSHRLRYLDHIEADGCALYRLACERKLEGNVRASAQ